jgi:hypothetical protein
VDSDYDGDDQYELPRPGSEFSADERPPEGFCCEAMESAVAEPCDVHGWTEWCPDRIVHYSARFDEYGIPILDGGSSVIVLSFCPWCGRSLPESKRDLRFERLEALGIDP